MKRAHDANVSIPVVLKKAHLEVPAAPYYDFAPLIEKEQTLRKHAKRSISGKWAIDFTSRDATLALTCVILKNHFNLRLILPPGHLVPTVPNRVQYITWAAALLGGEAPKEQIVVLDVGTGPSCIYPLLGSRMFPEWSFIGSDSDRQAIEAARQNCLENSLSTIRIVHTQSGSFFPKIILQQRPVLTLCNPPFHETFPQTENPAGTEAQLKTDGGELAFLKNMALESRLASPVTWFTSLVGRKKDLPKIVAFLRSSEVRAPLVKTAELSQGGRTVRWAVAWSFGSEHSSAMLLANSSSAWRCSVQVKPARQYANHLERQDIVAITCSAFDLLGWERKPMIKLNSDYDTVALQYRDQSGVDDIRDTEVLVDCLPKNHIGCFEVLLKINRKGGASPMFVQELAESVCKKIPFILDDSDE